MNRAVWALLFLLLQGCAVIQLPLGSRRDLEEVTLMGDGTDKVLLVEISGMLSFDRPWSLPGFAAPEPLPVRLRRELDRARRDPAVRALLVRIDSPGGTVTASDVLFHEIRSFREEQGIPVVAVVVEKGLSGGYYVALAADEIMAHPTALVGSVGVFVAKFDVSELLDRWGVRSELTKSGAQKDILSPLRPLGPGEQESLQAIVDEMQSRFRETVRTARPAATAEDLDQISTAAIYTAPRALELHMVDRLGYMEDALQSAISLAGLRRARLVAYRSAAGAGAGGPYSLGMWGTPAGVGPVLVDPRILEEYLRGGVYY